LCRWTQSQSRESDFGVIFRFIGQVFNQLIKCRTLTLVTNIFVSRGTRQQSQLILAGREASPAF
jgi:hypothetical protein